MRAGWWRCAPAGRRWGRMGRWIWSRDRRRGLCRLLVWWLILGRRYPYKKLIRLHSQKTFVSMSPGHEGLWRPFPEREPLCLWWTGRDELARYCLDCQILHRSERCRARSSPGSWEEMTTESDAFPFCGVRQRCRYPLPSWGHDCPRMLGLERQVGHNAGAGSPIVRRRCAPWQARRGA